MEPLLTWIDLTTADRDRMRSVLDLFREQGTLDEMGLGSLRDALADALFPGTSTLHTRLRYVLFIPWLYQRLARDPGGAAEVASAARVAELKLIPALERNEDTAGIIGAWSRQALSRLPSSVYWGALNRWGLFLPGQSQNWFHSRFRSLGERRHGLAHPDDPGLRLQTTAIWHPRLPAAPDRFPAELSFALRPEEAEFLQGRWESECPETLLAWLAREGQAESADAFWDDPSALSAPGELRQVIALARRFSQCVEGLPLLYNLLLAERRAGLQDADADGKAAGWVENYRADLAEWAQAEAAEPPFDPDVLWDFMARRGKRVPAAQRQLVETWAQRSSGVRAADAWHDEPLRKLVELRELRLKGAHRARLQNPARLLDWTGSAGVGRMDFRWAQVRRLLRDLHLGLAEVASPAGAAA
jgi:hypothetical protein